MQQTFVVLALCLAIYFGVKGFLGIRSKILLGKPETINDQSGVRWKNVLFIAFGQKKMFANPLVAILHAFIYVAFLITQVEFLEMCIDGVFGSHRLFLPWLGSIYTFIINSIEILSALTLIATCIFLIRRNLIRIPRFWKKEMTSWPRMDANLILLGEIFLVTGIFLLNGTDFLLQRAMPEHFPDTGNLMISSWIGQHLLMNFSVHSLLLLNTIGWWFHFLVVIGFLIYLPYSKHLHIFLAFVNSYFARLHKPGKMENMPAIMNEVKSMLGLSSADSTTSSEIITEFGAKDVMDLSWKNVMDAFTCTECGRCTNACPANQTGKKLSPRKVMMDVRDRAEWIHQCIEKKDATYFQNDKQGQLVFDKQHFQDGKNLFDSITPEEIHACTTCNACVEACPVLINPLDIILQLRRYEILTMSAGPQEWIPMFNGIENSGSPWQMDQARDQWSK